MSVRPAENTKTPAPPALTKWPKPPATFTKREQVAWAELGKAAMVLGTVSEADLIVAARAAKVMAKVDEVFGDADLKPSTLASMLRIEIDLLKQLGLSPQARRQVGALPSGEKKASGFEDIE